MAHTADTRLDSVVVGTDAPQLPAMSDPELTAADLWATGVAPDSHVVQYARSRLDAAGVVSVTGLEKVASGRGSRSAVSSRTASGRRRPTAPSSSTWRTRPASSTSSATPACGPSTGASHGRRRPCNISGKLERAEGVTNLIAERIEPLSLASATTFCDFS